MFTTTVWLNLSPNIAHGDLLKKPPLRVDFNSLIVNTGQEKKSLHQNIKANIKKSNSVTDSQKIANEEFSPETADVFFEETEAEPITTTPQAEISNTTTAQQHGVRQYMDGEIGWGKTPKMVDRRYD